MKVYTCKSFSGHWPVGTAAVVVAETADDAADFLEHALEKIGLAQLVSNDEMIELSMKEGTVTILCDGDY